MYPYDINTTKNSVVECCKNNFEKNLTFTDFDSFCAQHRHYFLQALECYQKGKTNAFFSQKIFSSGHDLSGIISSTKKVFNNVTNAPKKFWYLKKKIGRKNPKLRPLHPIWLGRNNLVHVNFFLWHQELKRMISNF